MYDLSAIHEQRSSTYVSTAQLDTTSVSDIRMLMEPVEATPLQADVGTSLGSNAVVELDRETIANKSSQGSLSDVVVINRVTDVDEFGDYDDIEHGFGPELYTTMTASSDSAMKESTDSNGGVLSSTEANVERAGVEGQAAEPATEFGDYDSDEDQEDSTTPRGISFRNMYKTLTVRDKADLWQYVSVEGSHVLDSDGDNSGEDSEEDTTAYLTVAPNARGQDTDTEFHGFYDDDDDNDDDDDTVHVDTDRHGDGGMDGDTSDEDTDEN